MKERQCQRKEESSTSTPLRLCCQSREIKMLDFFLLSSSTSFLFFTNVKHLQVRRRLLMPSIMHELHPAVWKKTVSAALKSLY